MALEVIGAANMPASTVLPEAEPEAAGRNCAYVSFLAGSGDYVKGIVGLAKGLRKVETAYPLVVAVLSDVPEEHRLELRRYGCIVREINPLSPPVKDGQFARSYYAINYCKLRIWEFTEYSKMIYLDGDIQVFDNIDHLFDLPDGFFYAVADCLCQLHQRPCPYVLQWPDELGPKPSVYFNAGMFVFEPDLTTYDDILGTLEGTPPTQFAEQDFLNMYFKDTYKPIPYVYNLLVAMLWRHPELIEFSKVKVVHYCVTGSKPWKYMGEEENLNRDDIRMLVGKWWEIFNDETLDYDEAHTPHTSTGAYKLMSARSDRDTISYMAAISTS